MYYARLRPEEAINLRADDVDLPPEDVKEDWGELHLRHATPDAGGEWTDDGSQRERRQLKHRAEGDSRIVPAHPELSRILRDHPAQFGTAPDGRLFSGVRGGELPTITYRRAWIRARQAAFTAAEQVSPLARRPYDLRHACLSTWLNGGVYPTQVAEWAGHSVDVLHPSRAQPPTGAENQDHDPQLFTQVRGQEHGLSNGGAGGARTHDRRIMSPLL